MEDDPDPAFRTYCPLFAARRPWQRGCIDELLRDIADDKVGGVLITDIRMRASTTPTTVAPTFSSPRPRNGTGCAIGMPTGSPVTPRVSDPLGSPPRSGSSPLQVPG
ncbi:hypothetical protein GCM10010524_27810 [Streptomyces mexicanus]